MNPILLLLFILCSVFATLSHATTTYPSIPGTTPVDVSAGAPTALIPPCREVYGNGRIFDISHRYSPDMPAFDSVDGVGQFLWLPNSMKNGSIANNSEMKLPAHTGTHVDAPGHVFDHYFDAGFDVDTLDLDVLNGAVLLVDVPRDKNITAEVMEGLHIPKGAMKQRDEDLSREVELLRSKYEELEKLAKGQGLSGVFNFKRVAEKEGFSFEKQVKIVIVTMTLHNYIRRHAERDRDFCNSERFDNISSGDIEIDDDEQEESHNHGAQEMKLVRDRIAQSLMSARNMNV